MDILKTLKHPLIVAPMAGGPSSVDLVAASSNAGVLGSIGAAYMTPAAIADFVASVRKKTSGPLAINLFVPSPDLKISPQQLETAISRTSAYRKELNLPEPRLEPPYEEKFSAQFEAVLKCKPQVFSYVFGGIDRHYVQAAKKEKIFLIGTATTLEEAQEIQDSGADAVVLQGIEAGGHRGIFDAKARDREIPAADLLRTCAGKIKIPLIAAGGIMSAEDIRSMLKAGAAAVQMGTAFLACREAGTSKAYRDRLLESPERKTRTTRAFSGRLARGLDNRFMNEMDKVPEGILPFPAQNKFTRDLRMAGVQSGRADFISLWSGTGRGDLWPGPAAELIESLFS